MEAGKWEETLKESAQLQQHGVERKTFVHFLTRGDEGNGKVEVEKNFEWKRNVFELENNTWALFWWKILKMWRFQSSYKWKSFFWKINFQIFFLHFWFSKCFHKSLKFKNSLLEISFSLEKTFETFFLWRF